MGFNVSNVMDIGIILLVLGSSSSSISIFFVIDVDTIPIFQKNRINISRGDGDTDT